MNKDLKPFEGLRKTFENETVLLIQKFRPLQVKYAFWLLHMRGERKHAFTNVGCWIEDVLSWLWFPVSLVVRKDLPMIMRPVKRKVKSVDNRMQDGQSEWREILSEREWKEVEKVHEYWTQEIDLHLYHHALGLNTSSPAPTSVEIESHYKSLLEKVKR